MNKAGLFLKAFMQQLVAIAVWLFVLEIILRVFPSPVREEYLNEKFNLNHKSSAPFTGTDPVLGRKNMPGAHSVVERSEYRMNVQINSKGLRGPEQDYQKKDGFKRLLFLGDSFTFGTGVQENETFVGLLTSEMPPGIEIINGSAPGSSTRDEYQFLKEEGHKYSPDRVILCFFQNDVQDNFQQVLNSQKRAASTGGFMAFIYKAMAKASSILENELYGKSCLYAAVTFFKKNFLLSYRLREDEFKPTEAALEDIRRFCADRNIPLNLVYIPRREEIKKAFDSSLTAAYLARYAGAHKVRLLDLWEEFRKDPRYASYYFPLDTHLSKEGNQAVASHLRKLLATDKGTGHDLSLSEDANPLT